MPEEECGPDVYISFRLAKKSQICIDNMKAILDQLLAGKEIELDDYLFAVDMNQHGNKLRELSEELAPYIAAFSKIQTNADIKLK